MGATRRSRWQRLTRGSVIGRVIRESGVAIDVHVISHPEARSEEAFVVPRTRRPAALPRRRAGARLRCSPPPGCPLLTLAARPAARQLELPSVMLLFLLLVVAVAAVGGLWPGARRRGRRLPARQLVLHRSRYHTFTIADAEDVLALFVFLAVGAIVSSFVALAARRAAEGARARAEAEALARLAGSSPVSARARRPPPRARPRGRRGPPPPRRRLADRGRQRRPRPREPRGEQRRRSSSTPSTCSRSPAGRSAARTSACSTPSPGSSQRPSTSASSRPRPQAAGAVSAANELRAALLSAVSHDLRTPLSAIKASVTSLLQRDVDWTPEARQEFLETIDEETDRLNALVGNLLDMSRLQAGALEISAAARRPRRGAPRRAAQPRRPRRLRRSSTSPRRFRACSPTAACSSGRSPT